MSAYAVDNPPALCFTRTDAAPKTDKSIPFFDFAGTSCGGGCAARRQPAVSRAPDADTRLRPAAGAVSWRALFAAYRHGCRVDSADRRAGRKAGQARFMGAVSARHGGGVSADWPCRSRAESDWPGRCDGHDLRNAGTAGRRHLPYLPKERRS